MNLFLAITLGVLLIQNGALRSSRYIRIEKHYLMRIKSLQSSSNKISASFGSDSLDRPDDEDSPEFREYLKKLLEMQSLRAKTGFSAPSSGSSEAYYAKLNRIKLERAARAELGLSEDDVDTDYKAEDYQSAG